MEPVIDARVIEIFDEFFRDLGPDTDPELTAEEFLLGLTPEDRDAFVAVLERNQDCSGLLDLEELVVFLAEALERSIENDVFPLPTIEERLEFALEELCETVGPDARDDRYVFSEDDTPDIDTGFQQFVTLDVLANDSPDDLIVSRVSFLSARIEQSLPPTAGNALAAGVSDNGAAVLFPLNSGFNGLAPGETLTATYSYTVLDAEGRSDTATISVDVEGRNDAPVAIDFVSSPGQPPIFTRLISEDGAAVIRADQVARDPDRGDSLSFDFVETDLDKGEVTRIGTDVIRFSTAGDFAGLGGRDSEIVTIGATVIDENGGSVPVTISFKVLGSGASATLGGGSGAPVIGTDGADRFDFVADPVPGAVDGRGGDDTVVLPDALADIRVTPVDSFAIDRPGGTLIVDNIETVELADATLTLTTGETVEDIILAYQTVFGRFARPQAIGNWAEKLEGGFTLGAMIDSFAASPEFDARYGALDDAGYVDTIFKNGLGRSVDPAGLAHYTDRLGSGAIDRADLALAIVTSDEIRERLADLLEDGAYLA